MKYSDWKSFDGLRFPTKYQMHSGDESGDSTLTLNAMEINPVVDAAVFERPQP
jgi:hypothetical protein